MMRCCVQQSNFVYCISSRLAHPSLLCNILQTLSEMGEREKIKSQELQMKSNLKVHIIVMPTISEQWYQREDIFFPLLDGSCTHKCLGCLIQPSSPKHLEEHRPLQLQGLVVPSDPLTVADWLANGLLDSRDAYTIDDNDDITRDKSLCSVSFPRR